jgi:hypothetical protein
MTTFHHTPGPWTLGDENNQCCDVNLGVQYNLTCSLDRQDANTGEVVISCDEMLANARLIAVAPELLKASNEVRQIMKSGQHQASARFSPTRFYEALEKLDAVILKATGTQ